MKIRTKEPASRSWRIVAAVTASLVLAVPLANAQLAVTGVNFSTAFPNRLGANLNNAAGMNGAQTFFYNLNGTEPGEPSTADYVEWLTPSGSDDAAAAQGRIWLVFDLGASYDLTSIRLWNFQWNHPTLGDLSGRGIAQFDIYVRNTVADTDDGTAWGTAINNVNVITSGSATSGSVFNVGSSNPWQLALTNQTLAKAPNTDTYTGTSFNLAGRTGRFVAIVADSNYGGDGYGLGKVRISGAAVPVPPPIPALRILPAGTNFALLWPTSITWWSLQWAASLTAPAWQPVTNAPAVVGDEFSVTLPNASAQRYFRLGPMIDSSTLTRKLMMGYQGWFACPGDGSAQNSWVHWFGNNTPTATNASFDFWPDTSELDADELFSTSMTYSNGSPAKLYSAYRTKTVVRHFKWMQENHLDGVFFQRFLSDLNGANISALRNQVAVNVRVGAETYGRVFAIMYDISGYDTNTLVSKLTNDWLYLVNTQRVTNSPVYLHHNGKPIVAIWGFGFNGRPDTPQQAQEAIDWFKAAGCTVMGGLPTNWRTLTGDAQTNPAWSNVFRSFDVISPWSVGRYRNNSGADSFRVNQIVPDLAAATTAGREYLPVIWPGFSWTNLNSGPFNDIPRNGGNFYWRQAYNAVRSGCTMLYGAMFDEVDEGTAMYKLAPTAAQLPAQGAFVPLNIDGYNLGSDWYLRLADQAGKMLRGEISVRSTIPITPP